MNTYDIDIALSIILALDLAACGARVTPTADASAPAAAWDDTPTDDAGPLTLRVPRSVSWDDVGIASVPVDAGSPNCSPTAIPPPGPACFDAACECHQRLAACELADAGAAVLDCGALATCTSTPWYLVGTGGVEHRLVAGDERAGCTVAGDALCCVH